MSTNRYSSGAGARWLPSPASIRASSNVIGRVSHESSGSGRSSSSSRELERDAVRRTFGQRELERAVAEAGEKRPVLPLPFLDELARHRAVAPAWQPGEREASLGRRPGDADESRAGQPSICVLGKDDDGR